jgi:ABC-2 type transport system permease protein
MRDFQDVLRFELRLQCGSPLFAGLTLLFFVIHLLALTQVGINLLDNNQVDYNSPYLIFRAESVLTLFGLLPALIFVVNAATRDQGLATTELFYVTPVGRLAFLLGRLAGGTACALLVALAGLLGMLAGTFMPWLEPERVAAFAWQPYVASFTLLVVPNLIVFSIFSFAVATLSRSVALSFAMALTFVVVALAINTQAGFDSPDWLSLLDPFGALAVEEASRLWSVAELNSLLPTDGLPANRALWLGLSGVVLALTCWRFRMQLVTSHRPAWLNQRHGTQAVPTPGARAWHRSFTARDTLAQFASQWRMDMRALLRSPLLWIVIALTTFGTLTEIRSGQASLMNLPVHPATSQMLGFVRFGLIQFVLIVLIFYSALLMHREREHGVHEIIGAAPYPDWLPLASKVLSLSVVLMLLLLVSVLTSIGWQASLGQSDLELGVYLQAVFVTSGFHFCMLGVLACVLQVLAPGKWSGMLVVAGALIVLLSLEAVGFEHILYGFRIPYVVYSDMNGFGHFLLPTYSLIAYWSAFCILLMVAGHLLMARGAHVGIASRFREAGTRFTPAVRTATVVAAAAFVLAGSWIFYNTNILNEYQTAESRLRQQADYERLFGSYKTKPAPAMTAIELAVDLYPRDRSLRSSGRATLRNAGNAALTEVFITADPRLSVDTLAVEGGTLTMEDKEQGFFLFKLNNPLPPDGTTALTWTAARQNRGFVNSMADNEIVENGTFVSLLTVMPLPMYDPQREVTNSTDRRRLGLPPAPRLPALGDPAALNTLGLGFTERLDFQVVVSTDADQVAVAPGVLRREWEQDGRRYFDYRMEGPIWPRVLLSSARYQVARDDWNGVTLEVYHDARHRWNVGTMLHTSKTALEYFSREFSPYMFSYFRIAEYARYRGAAQAFPGTISYSETAGFLTDLRSWAPLDYTTAHELAHQWWGGLAYGARMQGRQVLNEGLAQYSTFMLFKQQENPLWLRQVLANTHDGYLNARSTEAVAEQPVLKSEDQGYISYNKAALALFALQELIGADKVHQALRAYLDKFAMKPAPFPTSRDLVNELRAVAGPEYQGLITDLFEKIMLYDVQMTAAHVVRVGDQYEVTMDITARQFEADGSGNETEVPLDTWFEVVIFPESQEALLAQVPLYRAHHRLHGGTQRLSVRVPRIPGAAGVDPFHLMIDKRRQDNVRLLTH